MMGRLAVIGLVAVGATSCWIMGPIGSEAGDGADADADTDAIKGCYEGDYTITDPSSVPAFQPYECITGTLTVDATGLTSLILPSLEWVGGDLKIQSDVSLTILDMSALKTVDGILLISYNNALTSLVGLSNLTSVGGNPSISGNATLTHLVVSLRGRPPFFGWHPIQ